MYYSFELIAGNSSDTLMFINILARGHTVRYIQKIYIKYRRHSSSLAHQFSQMTESNFVMLHLLLLRYPVYSSQIRKAIAKYLFGIRHRYQSYVKALKLSFSYGGTWKAGVAFALYLLSIGYIKL